MALRSVLCGRAAIARGPEALAPSSCKSLPVGPSTARTSPICFKGRCLSSLSSSAAASLQDLQEAPSMQESPSPTSPPSEPAAAAAAAESSTDLDALDIRVGRITKAWKHPEADSLYVEEVDLAEPDGPRTICSGLVKYISLEELQERTVMVLANLKPRNMRGVKSNGMLLAASDTSHENVELLTPSEGSVPGERAWFGAEADKETQKDAATPNQKLVLLWLVHHGTMPPIWTLEWGGFKVLSCALSKQLQKKKIWEGIQPELKTSEECVVIFQGKPMQTSTGVVTCKSLKGANVG